MYYYEIAPLQIVRQDKAVFTYFYEGPLNPGQLVLIEVGKKVITGVVMRNVEQPSYDTKPVSTVIEDIPLPLPLLRLAEWMSTYYDTHLALVMQTVLPRGLTKNRRTRESTIQRPIRQRTNIVFNSEQTEALKQIESSTPGTILLHGITGSGKTAIYIEVVQRMIADGKSAIILVPEISLTPQIVDEFSSRFDNIILTHSRQTEAERHLAWKDALNANEPRVAIGPRSALFLPLNNIGVVIIDESHEPSFKQEQSPRYSALRAASMLTSFHSAKLILGSATPSIDDYYLAQKNKRPIIKMTSTARLSAKPSIELIDMTKRQNFTRHRFMSDRLIASIEQTLASKKQSLVFHNRRGSASTTLCENCGWQATCARCFIPMTLHIDKHELRCHICGNTDHVPTSCPICKNASIIHKGIGTKLIESELKRLFPKARIARFDGDSENGETLDKFYTELYEGAVDIIVGTQIIAKGLDLPELRTVGVIQADAGLSLPDFGSTERTFQLLSQVVGRVGRNEHETSVIVQSYQPSHSSVVYGLSQNYSAFYEQTIAERERAHFPPFAFILKLICVYKTEAAAIRNAQSLARTLRVHTQGIQILGPTPAFYERQRDTYRWQLVLKSNQRALLVDALQHLPASHWQFELDPVSLL
jgi:primosomal protein N' (replication factor Y) (superfamily II helicase)